MKHEKIRELRNKCKHSGSHINNSLCEYSLNCYECYQLINHHRLKEAEVLKYNLKSKTLYTIASLEIIPVVENLHFYSLNGIEKLVSNFIYSKDIDLVQDLINRPIWIQTYFTENEVFNLPILNIQIIIDWELEEKYCDNIFIKCLDYYSENIIITNYIDFFNMDDLFDEPKLAISCFYKSPILGFRSFSNTILKRHNNEPNTCKELDKIFSSKIIQLNKDMVDEKTGIIQFLNEERGKMNTEH